MRPCIFVGDIPEFSRDRAAPRPPSKIGVEKDLSRRMRGIFPRAFFILWGERKRMSYFVVSYNLVNGAFTMKSIP